MASRHDASTTAALTPGPGAYDISNVPRRGPQCSIGRSGRAASETRSRTPGPGAYGDGAKSSTPKWGFGTAQRPISGGPAKNAPGPGAYNVDGPKRTRHAYSIGGSGRTERRPESGGEI